MLVLIYENGIGKIEMGGGGSRDWRITEITGLALPPKSYNTVTYAGQNGQETLSEVSGARVITIAGDLKNNTQTRYHLANAARIFNMAGVLKLYLHDKQRKISCRVNAFELGGRNGAVQPFTLQLTADSPDFEEMEKKTVYVFRRIDMVDGENLLPMELTRYITGADIIVLGDVKTEPVININCISGGVPDASAEVRIENTDTGQFIKLQYAMQTGESITVDIPTRKITSSINGNIITCISDDTFLSAFWLVTGLNHVEVTCSNQSQKINVICEFTSRYIEAVY